MDKSLITEMVKLLFAPVGVFIVFVILLYAGISIRIALENKSLTPEERKHRSQGIKAFRQGPKKP